MGGGTNLSPKMGKNVRLVAFCRWGGIPASLHCKNHEYSTGGMWILILQVSYSLKQIPSTVGDEKTYNPFLRTDNQAIMEAVGVKTKEGEDLTSAREKVLADLRACKDKFNYVL